MKLHPSLSEILLPAYAPCADFSNACNEMRWIPEAGHVPRGFLGACGDLSDVELILVFAEPGDPHFGETHTGLASAYDHAMMAFCTGKAQPFSGTSAFAADPILNHALKAQQR
jgi:hypothetical protein